MSKELDELFNALYKVRRDAVKQKELAEQKRDGPPRPGDDLLHHRSYWQREIDLASAVINYCVVREMQINPD